MRYSASDALERTTGWGSAVTVSATATVTHHGGRLTGHGPRTTTTGHVRTGHVETTSIGSTFTAVRSISIAA